MLNAMIEESRASPGQLRRMRRVRPVRHVDQPRPRLARAGHHRSRTAASSAGASALGSLTVQRSTVAASAQSTGLITASSAPAPPSSDEQRDRTSDGPG